MLVLALKTRWHVLLSLEVGLARSCSRVGSRDQQLLKIMKRKYIRNHSSATSSQCCLIVQCLEALSASNPMFTRVNNHVIVTAHRDEIRELSGVPPSTPKIGAVGSHRANKRPAGESSVGLSLCRLPSCIEIDNCWLSSRNFESRPHHHTSLADTVSPWTRSDL